MLDLLKAKHFNYVKVILSQANGLLTNTITLYGPLDQLDRSSDFESEGWEFESLRGRH